MAATEHFTPHIRSDIEFESVTKWTRRKGTKGRKMTQILSLSPCPLCPLVPLSSIALDTFRRAAFTGAMATPEPHDYQVDLDIFRGPLDLLLYLVKRDEVDVRDISIAARRAIHDYLERACTCSMSSVPASFSSWPPR